MAQQQQHNHGNQIQVQMHWKMARIAVKEKMAQHLILEELIKDEVEIEGEILNIQQLRAVAIQKLNPLEVIPELLLTLLQLVERDTLRNICDLLDQILHVNAQELQNIQADITITRAQRDSNATLADTLLSDFDMQDKWVVLVDVADLALLCLLKKMKRPLRFVIGRSLDIQVVGSMGRVAAQVGIPALNWRRLMEMEVDGTYRELSLQECLNLGFMTH